MKVEPLEVEVASIPGARLCLAHFPESNQVILTFGSPSFGFVKIEMNEACSPRLERWFHLVSQPQSHEG